MRGVGTDGGDVVYGDFAVLEDEPASGDVNFFYYVFSPNVFLIFQLIGHFGMDSEYLLIGVVDIADH